MHHVVDLELFGVGCSMLYISHSNIIEICNYQLRMNLIIVFIYRFLAVPNLYF